MNVLFVYAKDGKVRVLNMETAKANNDKMLLYGWKHTATIDPCVWMENLYNNSDDIDVVAEVRELSLTRG